MDSETTDPQVILFVDDEPSILSALRRLCRPLGYRILLAESGKAGLEILRNEKVDLVVSDMRMPEMDGAAFLEQVRANWPEVGRILLTGYADVGATVAAVNRGEIQRYIAKPWDDRELLISLQDGLARRRLEQENKSLLQLTRRQNDELAKLNADLAHRVKARTQELEQVNAMLEKSFEQLQENFLLSIKVFSGLLELRDGGLAGYSREVADLARRMARAMNAGPQLEQDVHIAGLLHEVGKIGFPDALLRKPLSAMTGEELALYKRHTLNGEAALLPLGQLQKVARLVRSLHERLDGKGYPDGLSGEEIPLGAQILGLASDFYAVQSGRLAQRRQSEHEAQLLIRGGAGTRYAADVIEAFETALRERTAEKREDRALQPSELEPGMVLSRDLLSPQGTLLLASGFVFDERVVRQVKEFAKRDLGKMVLYVGLQDQSASSVKPGLGTSVATGAP